MKRNLSRKWGIVVSCVVSISCGEASGVKEKHSADTATRTETAVADTNALQNVIIPGDRLGHIALGLNADSIETILGPPDASDAAMGKAWLTWNGKSAKPTKLQLYTAYKDSSMAQKTVQQIRTTSAYFKTRTGLQVGSTLSEINKNFPDLRKTASYTDGGVPAVLYDAIEKGIAFEIQNGRCEGILLHPKSKRADAIYIMLHSDMKRL